MSKMITPEELAEIVNRLLTGAHEIDTYETFQSFMTEIATVVCDHCGGEVHHPAGRGRGDDAWFVGIHGNDSLPDNGGVWRNYDPEGVF